MSDVQTSFDLPSAGLRQSDPAEPSYPFKRTPMDDTFEAARQRRLEDAERRQYRALREWEARRGA